MYTSVTVSWLFPQIMCSESDLKDLGLPMGPRKKLQGLLRDEQNKKVFYSLRLIV